MIEWIREEQARLWGDLDDAIYYAADGEWSIRAANVAQRIIEAARIVGPTHYGGVPWTLLAGGVYDALLNAAGIEEYVMPGGNEWHELESRMRHHESIAELYDKLAGTRAAIEREEWE